MSSSHSHLSVRVAGEAQRCEQSPLQAKSGRFAQTARMPWRRCFYPSKSTSGCFVAEEKGREGFSEGVPFLVGLEKRLE